MGLFSKLAWLALPALAGCGVLLQVSSQGTGASPGGNASGDGLIASNQLLAMLTGTTTGIGQLVWNGEPIAEDDLVELKPSADGTLTLPLITKDGKIDPIWKTDSSLSITAPVEAGKAHGLRVSGADADTPIVVTKPSDKGVITSEKFPITSDMKTLDGLRIIGNGDMADTYVGLKISIDGGPVVMWARQAPSSNAVFETFRVDLSKVLERAAGKNVVGQCEVVDGGASRIIGVANAFVRPTTGLEVMPDPMLLSSPYSLINRTINVGLTTNQTRLVHAISNLAGDKFNITKYSGDFGVTDENLRKMCLLITREIIKDEYNLEGVTDASIIERTIRNGVTPYFSLLNIDDNKLLQERLLAHAYSIWVRTRLSYDQTYFTQWDENKKIQGDQSKYVLSWLPRRAVCGGIQVTFRDIAKAGGLKVAMITCHTRGQNNTPSGHANHTVAVLEFRNELCLPFDGSSSTISLEDARRSGGAIHSHWSLPITANEMAVFLAYRHQQNENNFSFGDPQNTTIFVKASLDEWKKWNVSLLDRFEPKPIPNSGFYYGN